MIERVDCYSDDEFQQAQEMEAHHYQQELDQHQAHEQYAYECYIMECFNDEVEDELSDILP